MAFALNSEAARHFADEWIAAWNAHDLDAILSHYAEGIVFVSPKVVAILGDPTGTVRGIEALRAYFGKGLAAYPELHFKPIELLIGVTSLTIYYYNRENVRAAEVFEFDGSGKVARAWAHYATAAEE